MKLTVILLLLLWGNVEFTLTLQECSELPSVKHAFVLDEYKKAEYQKGDVIYFCCDPGYTTGLNTTYICTERGWSAATYGQCVEDTFPLLLACTHPPPLTNGYVLQNSTLVFENGQNVGYRCHEFHTMRGRPYKTCTNGQWTGDIQCLKTSCSKPQSDHFQVEGEKTVYREREVLRYKCDKGYKKVNRRPSRCLIIGQSAQWTPPPQCELITCKLSSNPPNGTTYFPQNQNIFNPGQRVRVMCGDKQWVKNTTLQRADLTCEDTGQWDFVPVCQLVKCYKTDERVYWLYWRNSADIDETQRYVCRNGYVKTSDRATCTRQGWEPSPLCKEPQSCGAPPSLENGDFFAPSGPLGHNTRVQYQCQDKYTMQGGPHKTCLNGEWTGEIKCLKPCTVTSDLMEPNKIRFRYSRENKVYAYHNDHVSFNCVAGATPDGQLQMRQICIDGVLFLPKCV